MNPESAGFYVWCIPALVGTAGILVPFAVMLYYTLTNRQLTPAPWHFVGVANYVAVLTSSEFWHAMYVTVAYAAGACLIEVPLGLIVAWGLSLDFFGARVLRVVIILPMLIPPVIGALVWKMMLNPTTGVLAYALNGLGVHHFAGFASATTALPTIVMVDVWLFTPFVILILLAGIRGVPPEILEAAATDGATFSQRFVHVVLPMIRPHIWLVALFRLVDCLKVFDTIYATTGGGPVTATQNLTLDAYIRTFQWHEVGRSLVFVVLLFVLIFALSQVLMRRWQAALELR